MPDLSCESSHATIHMIDQVLFPRKKEKKSATNLSYDVIANGALSKVTEITKKLYVIQFILSEFSMVFDVYSEVQYKT